ncbi:hypothetical protein ACIOEZ_05270 [Streptomyces sp. NPDC087866]|uniref:hypothetical protein n=1 Tax=unclassified Streptomyces TaxID=2593676 RepID=UPI00225AE237|nr:hypothetical protein [Streptomyces sp. NBC_01789]MCX4446816.1 hypothetical protein [Streptomyces sp. NBC_01789]
MPHLFLNEKSCETTADPDRVNRAMTELVRTIIAVARVDRPGTVLVAREPVNALRLAEDHPIAKWIGTPGAKELWQRLLLMQTKYPHEDAYPDGETFSDVAYSHDGVPVTGLGAAHLMGGAGVSLKLDPRWDADRVTLQREELLDEEADGSALSEVHIPHAATREHVETHLPWIREEVQAALKNDLSGIRTGAELWERCPDLFPHLRFLPHVEAQIRELKQYWVHPVRKRLAEMDHAVEVWDAAIEPEGPLWGSTVTPEHGARKREYCLFTDLDGTDQYFDTHLRFTPGAGRLHFRFLQVDRRAHVAHIGNKLGI